MISVLLVILVVFVFLRSARATLIPSVAVPVSLIGTFSVMYLLGYSLDNLSLMALTISTGFVVDDAIVVMENISRYVEQGMAPFDAAMKGAQEIGFTVLTMSISLIAVFIPLLMMGGIVGRLFREFAVTLSITILFSLIISLTATPCMCAHLLKHHEAEKHGAIFRFSERALRETAGRLPSHASLGPGQFLFDAHGPAVDHRAQRRTHRKDTQGLLPPAGHGSAPGRHARPARRLLPGDECLGEGGNRRHQEGSRGRRM